MEVVKRLGELSLGVRLEVISQSDFPLRPIVTVRVPPTFRQVNIIPKLIGKQNDGLTARK